MYHVVLHWEDRDNACKQASGDYPVPLFVIHLEDRADCPSLIHVKLPKCRSEAKSAGCVRQLARCNTYTNPLF